MVFDIPVAVLSVSAKTSGDHDAHQAVMEYIGVLKPSRKNTLQA